VIGWGTALKLLRPIGWRWLRTHVSLAVPGRARLRLGVWPMLRSLARRWLRSGQGFSARLGTSAASHRVQAAIQLLGAAVRSLTPGSPVPLESLAMAACQNGWPLEGTLNAHDRAREGLPAAGACRTPGRLIHVSRPGGTVRPRGWLRAGLCTILGTLISLDRPAPPPSNARPHVDRRGF
jgi:hypothetical protein